MTKAQIVRKIHARTGVKSTAVMQIVNELMNTIKDDMAEDNNVYLRGFGTFVVRRYSSKHVYNINTASYKTCPPHRVPFFKPGKDMMAQVSKRKK